MITLEEARNIFNDERMRSELLTKYASVISEIDRKIRTRDCEYNWTEKTITVTIRPAIKFDDDMMTFIAQEYIRNGKFPVVLTSGNTVLRNAVFTFYLENQNNNG